MFCLGREGCCIGLALTVARVSFLGDFSAPSLWRETTRRTQIRPGLGTRIRTRTRTHDASLTVKYSLLHQVVPFLVTLLNFKIKQFL